MNHRQLNRHRPGSRQQRLHYYVNYRPLNRRQPVFRPPAVNYYSNYRRPVSYYTVRRQSARRRPVSRHYLQADIFISRKQHLQKQRTKNQGKRK